MWIKICGIRDVETASWVAAFEPDAIGLNFYAQSARVVSRDVATEICRIVPDSIEKVGVFVNHSTAEIVRIVNECGLTAVQLHGDELPVEFDALRSALPTTKLLRAFRIDITGAESIAASWRRIGEYLDTCRTVGVNPYACLIDAFVPGSYGGTGQAIFEAVQTSEYDRYLWPPLILAGGLTPENVVRAVESVRPWGVDVASGVESSRGVKDRTLIERFIANARSVTSVV